jgi:acetate kinase
MNIFVINSGSSSIKYQLFNMPATAPVCSGLIESIGAPSSLVTHSTHTGVTIKLTLTVKDHKAGIHEIQKLLTDPEFGVIKDTAEIMVVGHRVVHGGESFAKGVIITSGVKGKIKALSALAPLHNPINYKGILIAENMFKSAVQVAIFDTAFHHTMPEKAFRYAIPNKLYTDHGIRVYGFHGISHKYVTEKALSYLGKPEAKIITIHLGNGCSMAAVAAGQCIDTSMGLSPLDGLIMGTRPGNIDAAVILHLMGNAGYTLEELNSLLNKQSGMLGLTGKSDMRDIKKLINEGNAAAKLAYEMYAYRIKKYIGSYSAAMNGLDAIVFTAGVGENDSLIRKMVCENMEFLGIRLDPYKNASVEPGIKNIGMAGAHPKILVIPTNEELEIARQCYGLLKEPAKDINP